MSGGESLGYYVPPNSDELLIRLESMFFPDFKAHLQFQMIRHGVDYDDVYQWNNVIKLGASYKFIAGPVPISVYAEFGFVSTSFTITGVTMLDPVYRTSNSFLFSIGFRLFPR
jgi:hypothetical protein